MAARLPGVYVTVEDRSYIEDQVADGRTGLIVIMSDRGPHNTVYQSRSNMMFFSKFGRPNIERTGQAHYMASQFLRRSNNLYVVRAALLNSSIPTHNCSLSNVAIRYTPTQGGTEEIIGGDFIFTAAGPVDIDGAGPLEPIYLGQWDEDNSYQVFGSPFMSKYVFCNYIGWDSVNVDDYISIDGSYESLKVVAKGQIPLYDEETGIGQGSHQGNAIYYLELSDYYTGRSTETTLGQLPIKLKNIPVKDEAGNDTTLDVLIPQLIAERDAATPPSIERIAAINAFINPLVSNLNNYTYLLYDSAFINENTKFKTASRFYFGPRVVKFTELNGSEYFPKCAFTKNSNIVYCETEKAFESIYQEEWIMSEEDFQAGLAEGLENQPILRQIIEKISEIDDATGTQTFKLILDAPYTGNTTEKVNGNWVWDKIYSHVPVQTVSAKNLRSHKDLVTNDIYTLFHFYAEGVGSYYNNIYLEGVRNYQMEKMYTDDNGVPLYKYIFMDLTIYGQNEDGTRSILEGPWTVSLVNKVGDQVVRDLNTGRELYIVNTINERSNFIRCKEGVNVSVLEGRTKEKEELRLKILALFSTSFVYRTKTRGQEGFFLENGGDGIQYDQYGRLNLYHPEIASLIRNAYAAEIYSEDGSIQLITQTLYPWYLFDYVISGGYDVDIQSAARELVDIRKDCLLLADSGSYKFNAIEDLNARKMDIPWNTWNAMIYSQYRTITDPYSGKQLTISPVYHAIERHLTVDNNYFMSEPVAGIEKGALQERAVLAYKPSLVDMEEMIDVEINPTITEPDGTYFLTQFTSYKRMSVMKRAHAVKIIHHLQKRLPSLLKDLLQRKGTPYWINVADSRVKTFMNQFINPNTPKHSFSSFNVNLVWDEERSEIYIGLTVKPLRAIEAIHVNIIVT